MNAEELDRLIAKYLSGNALPNEAVQLEDWLAQSELNRQYFHEAQKVFGNKSMRQVSTEAAWQKVKPQLQKAKTFQLQQIWVGMAAGLIVVSGLFYFLINSQPAFVPPAPLLSFESGKQDTALVLQDGNQVSLLAHSALVADAAYGKTNRLMHLTGSAYFNIQRHDSLPFMVKSSNLYIKDIGTRFWVKTSQDNDTIWVKVEEGMVFLFDSLGTSKQLAAGEEIRYSKQRGAFLQTQYKDTLHFSFHFTNQKLEEVVSLLENAFHRKITLERAALKNCRLTARFEKENLETILLVIAETMNLIVETTPDGYLIKGESCQ